MDEGKRHYRLGLFVVVSVVALAVLLFLLGGRKLFQPTFTFETIQVRRDTPELIKLGLRAQTQLAGITGQQYLGLDYLDPAKHPPLEFDWTPKYTYLPSAPSRTGEILAKAQVFVANLSEVDVKKLDADLNRLLVNLNDKVGALPVAELSADADKVLRNANATIVRADETGAEGACA